MLNTDRAPLRTDISMTAYAWSIGAGEVDASKEILAADEYRDELVVQLHTQVVPGDDPVFIAFGEDATTENGIMLGGIGHTARVLGAKARLTVNVISAAASSGGIETHTSIEYRHVPNYPIWQTQPGEQSKPVALHYLPFPIWGAKWWDYTALDTETVSIMFDMNVQAGAGNLYLYDSDDNLIETIAIEDADFDGSIVEFTLLTSPLTEDTTYYILVDAGAIESTDGVAWGGIADEIVWSFSTSPGL